MSESIPDTHYRLVVIDGSELGLPIDFNGGRVVCIDGTGDQPLSTYTIDPAQCVPTIAEVPVITPLTPIPAPAIPEPATWVLMLPVLLAAYLKSKPKKSNFLPGRN